MSKERGRRCSASAVIIERGRGKEDMVGSSDSGERGVVGGERGEGGEGDGGEG